ncbi:MAG: DUF86 domain-containing protein [Thermomicrobiales bacterium]
MRPKTAQLLWDIQDSAQFIFLQTEGLSFEAFEDSRTLRRVVERELEILGEAARRIRDHDPDVAARLPGLHEAIGVRNVIAHEYHDIQYDRIWVAIRGPLHRLEQEASRMLNELGPPVNSG